MPRRLLSFDRGEFYHLYNRGNNRKPLFSCDDHYTFFLSRFVEYFNPKSVETHAFVLMPNHFHFALRLARMADLSDLMKRLAMSYAKALNAQQHWTGHVFESRFKAIRIESPEQLDYLTRYIHLNPVEAKLCQHPFEWRYSSIHEYLHAPESPMIRVNARFADRSFLGRRFPNVHTEDILSRFRDRSHYLEFMTSEWNPDRWVLENGIWRDTLPAG